MPWLGKVETRYFGGSEADAFVEFYLDEQRWVVESEREASSTESTAGKGTNGFVGGAPQSLIDR